MADIQSTAMRLGEEKKIEERKKKERNYRAKI